MLEYQNMKIFLQTVTLQLGLKRFLWLKMLKILCRGHMLLIILTEKKLLQLSQRKIAETNQKEFRIKKVIKRNDDKIYVKWRT